MDNKTKMSDVCITTLNICNSNKDNGNSNDVANGNPQWGEDVVIELMNITIIIDIWSGNIWGQWASCKPS